MERARNILVILAFGVLVCGGTSWGFTRSLLDATDQTDPAWQVAEAPASTSTSDSSSVHIPNKNSNKSPGVAVGLALVPGVALHGAGYLYAGRPWTAGALLLAEAGGLYMAYRGGTDIYSAVDGLDFDKFSNFHGDTGQLSRGMGLALGGVMIFLTSWLVDITGSPMAVEQSNVANKPAPAASAAPEIIPRLTAHGFEVAVERRF
jgi:hypothetical protein